MPQYQNKIQDSRLCNVEKHIEVINGEMGDIKVDLAQVKTNVCWLVKSYWVIVIASVGALIGAIINLVLK